MKRCAIIWSFEAQARLSLSAVLAYSVVGKLATRAARDAYVEAVASFGGLGPRGARTAAQVLAAVIITAEAVLGAGLWIAGYSRACLIGTAVLLLVFAAALGLGLRRGIHRSCACFGSGGAPARPLEVGRDVLLAVVALLGAARDAAPTGALAGPAAASADRLLIALFTAVLAAGLPEFADILNPRKLTPRSTA
ncbi:hypothetical protein KDL01_01105 [Actinospica durhamensis]|uniref:Methylamine utilisation protein MauE domain-containing protein n=1 Tax=Actinospica durhamensis TaxID=1508375 RepID=A0A941IR14_9ACTN|nr:MauE/DoxX family redox-associated membrane protein [Actinospica durhamensis]MBR7831836.1 hypothetical protein [Actinospica durhamensis]